RRCGEARLPAGHVQRGRTGLHDAVARRFRSAWHRESREDVSRRRSPCAATTGTASTGEGRCHFERMTTPATSTELAEAVRDMPRVLAVGAGTKPRLSAVEVPKLSTAKLSGIVEYEPEEFTFTALAGTPIREIAAALAERGQYLPFDPMLV